MTSTPKQEKSYIRKNDFKGAELARKTNHGKVMVRMDKRTHIMVPITQRDKYEIEARMNQAKRPENKEKVTYLESKMWKMGPDGVWRNRENFLHRDMESALNLSGYYDRNRTSRS